jgi:hypothetical protein
MIAEGGERTMHGRANVMARIDRFFEPAEKVILHLYMHDQLA